MSLKIRCLITVEYQKKEKRSFNQENRNYWSVRNLMLGTGYMVRKSWKSHAEMGDNPEISNRKKTIIFPARWSKERCGFAGPQGPWVEAQRAFPEGAEVKEQCSHRQRACPQEEGSGTASAHHQCFHHHLPNQPNLLARLTSGNLGSAACSGQWPHGETEQGKTKGGIWQQRSGAQRKNQS